MILEIQAGFQDLSQFGCTNKEEIVNKPHSEDD